MFSADGLKAGISETPRDEFIALSNTINLLFIGYKVEALFLFHYSELHLVYQNNNRSYLHVE